MFKIKINNSYETDPSTDSSVSVFVVVEISNNLQNKKKKNICPININIYVFCCTYSHWAIMIWSRQKHWTLNGTFKTIQHWRNICFRRNQVISITHLTNCLTITTITILNLTKRIDQWLIQVKNRIFMALHWHQ